MNEKIEYGDLLKIEWALRSAELRAKSEWDDVVHYGKDDLLYELNYEKVKELREAQKLLKNLWKTVRNSEDIEVQYSA